eukprot:Colp12_sorted_trinity150504_noHs@3851
MICSVYTDISTSGSEDSLTHSVNYGALSKSVFEFAEVSNFKTVEALAYGIAQLGLSVNGVKKITVRVEKPSALLYAASAGVELTRTKADFPGEKPTDFTAAEDFSAHMRNTDKVFVKDLLVRAIIGVNPWEREEKQSIVLNLEMSQDIERAAASDKVSQSINYRTVCKAVVAFVEASEFKTVEALATAVAKVVVVECGASQVTVRLEKPSALIFADSAGVEITRTARQFAQ